MIEPAMSPLPITRHDARAAWETFLPTLGAYAHRRNHVEPLHRNVSRLSAALRYRLLTEDEVVEDTLQKYDFKVVEKWLQEVCWRSYWKGWLEMRPDVWKSWQRQVGELNETLPESILKRAHTVAIGQSGVACMDVIARELTTTGYLHNHARMWWASYWIHVERLPWELGADWFFRHLLDADPASNTLSWRWVAGLQTVGKTYLVSLSNLEKYAATTLLADRTGSERIADGELKPVIAREIAETTRQALPGYATSLGLTSPRVGLWLHADDLLPEQGPLANVKPLAIAAFSSTRSYQQYYQLSKPRIDALHVALRDACQRAAHHFNAPFHLDHDDDPVTSLLRWAKAHALDEVVAFAPTVGPIQDMLPRLQRHLAAANLKLTLIRRPSDAHAFGLCGSGFFPFWQKMSRHLQTPAMAPVTE